MRKIIASTLIASMLSATAVFSGGPVLVLEETAEAAPTRDNSWIVPVVIGLLILGAVASGGGDDAPVDEPQPCKFTGEGGC